MGRIARLEPVLPKKIVDRFEPLLADPSTAGLFCDFDGTMAEIVLDPAAARPVEGAPAAMAELSDSFGRVGVLSGRPLTFLEQFFSPSLLLAGLYGLEWSEGGIRHDHPQAGVWREVVADVAACSRARGPVGMLVEPKGLSLTLHYREHPGLAADVHRWAVEQATRSGLVVRPARMSVELHPPIDADKGSAVLAASELLGSVCFIGDDVGDLAAFDALDRLDAGDVATLRVVVVSDEVAPELLDRADVTLDGPRQVVALLGALVARTRA